MAFDNEDEFGTTPDDERRIPARIAAPGASSAMPAVALRGLGPVPSGSTADLESKGIQSHLASAPIAKPSSLDTRKAADEAEYQRKLSTGSGISQIKNPFARGALRGLETIGNVLSPASMKFIPGTELHHNALLRADAGRLGADEAAETREATNAKTAADTEEAQARARSLDAATAAAGQPKPKEESWKVVPGVIGPGGKVLQEEANSGQLRWAEGIEGVGALKSPAEKPDNPEQQLLDAEQAVSEAKTPEEKRAAQAKLDQLKQSIRDYAANSQRPEREKPGAASARSDKSYTYNNDKLDKLGKPIEDAVARMGRLQESLAQNSPQADALIAPELLTIMAGGQGSGLRMNEAEISRVVGGRSKWQSLEAAANQWRLDPSKANSITPDQRQEIRALVQAVNAKLLKKQQALDQAREGLLNTDDPKEHRRIVTDAHHALSTIDETAPSGEPERPANVPANYIYKKDGPKGEGWYKP